MRYSEKLTRKYSVSDYVYERINSLQDTDRVFVIAFGCVEGFQINDQRAKEIFKTIVFVLQSIEVNFESKLFIINIPKLDIHVKQKNINYHKAK